MPTSTLKENIKFSIYLTLEFLVVNIQFLKVVEFSYWVNVETNLIPEKDELFISL